MSDVSAGVDCEKYGGWWMPVYEPPITKEMRDSARDMEFYDD